MKKFAAAIAAALALTLSACGGDDPQPIETVTPAPWPGETAGPSPTGTPTPSQEKLSAQAEHAYRAFFDEWTRLERAGGADEPTQILLDNGAGDYLNAVMLLLRDQKANGVTVEGPMPTARVLPAPGGDFRGIDPRLTLRVCEDHRAGRYTDSEGTHPQRLLEGTLYLAFLDGRPKIVAGTTEATEQCTF